MQPPARARGEIARTMLYMSNTYGFLLSDQAVKLYHAWNNEDPPTRWERERDSRIKLIQGRGNRSWKTTGGSDRRPAPRKPTRAGKCMTYDL